MIYLIDVGTCGWGYKEDWQGVFYPEKIKTSQLLEFYSKIFRTVEIDSSFYHIPAKKVVEGWANRSPQNFSFSAKFPQEFTHKAKVNLSKGRESLLKYLENISPLEINGKMDAHLLQLPPSFDKRNNFEDFAEFLTFWKEWQDNHSADRSITKSEIISTIQPWQLVVEFRHKSWMEDYVFDLLKQNSITYCAVVEPLLPPRLDITNPDLAYIRFHGYGKKPWWNYLFSADEIRLWANKINQLKNENPATKILIYFNNHFSGNAIKNALDIMPQIGLTPENDFEDVFQNFMPNIAKMKQKAHKKLDNWL